METTQGRHELVEKLVAKRQEAIGATFAEEAEEILIGMEENPLRPTCTDKEGVANILKSWGMRIEKKYNEAAEGTEGKTRKRFAGLWDIYTPEK